jgi:hypothetical protein
MWNGTLSVVLLCVAAQQYPMPLETDTQARDFYATETLQVRSQLDEAAVYLHLHYSPTDLLTHGAIASKSLQSNTRSNPGTTLTVDLTPYRDLIGNRGVKGVAGTPEAHPFQGAASALAIGLQGAQRVPKGRDHFQRYLGYCGHLDLTLCHALRSARSVSECSDILEHAAPMELLLLSIVDRRALDADPEVVPQLVLMLSAALEGVCDARLAHEKRRSRLLLRECDATVTVHVVLYRLLTDPSVYFVGPQDSFEDGRELLSDPIQVARTYDYTLADRVRGTREETLVRARERFQGVYWDRIASLAAGAPYDKIAGFDEPKLSALDKRLWAEHLGPAIKEPGARRIDSYIDFLELIIRKREDIQRSRTTLTMEEGEPPTEGQ